MLRNLTAATALSLIAVPLCGQERQSRLRDWLRPRITLRSAGWSSSRALDDRGPLFGLALWGEVSPALDDDVKMHLSGRAAAGSSVRDDAETQLRELYVDLHHRSVDVRAGKQIIAWGRADAVNPTDNLTPRDGTLLVADDEDQKSGVPALRIAFQRRDATVSLYWLPIFASNTVPLPSRPPGVVVEHSQPPNQAAQGALRIDRSNGVIDWSVSYFTGYDLNADVALRDKGDGASALILSHHRLRVLGADGSMVAGRYGLRAEAALILTDDRNGSDAEIKNSTLQAVFGADRTFGGYFNVNVQYVVRRVVDFVPVDAAADSLQRHSAFVQAQASQQQRRMQHGATLRVEDQWFHEALRAEVAIVLLAPPRQFLVRPRVDWAISDRFQLRVGADLADGEAGSLFRVLRKNSLAFAELRLGL